MTKQRRRSRIASSVALVLLHVAVVSMMLTPAAQAAAPLMTIGVNVSTATSQRVTYAIAVANRGSAVASGVTVTDPVPPNTTFVESTPAPASGCANGGSPGEAAGTACLWSLGNLEAGRSQTITVTLELDQSLTGYTVVNSAEVSCCEGDQRRSDTDRSLVRHKVEGDHADDDMYFQEQTAPVPASSTHGACEELRISGDNKQRSYIDLKPLPAEGSIGRLFAAQLSLEVAEAGAGAVAAHRITGTDWSDGSGECQVGSPTTAAPPSSAPTATAITSPVPAADQRMIWEVGPDLDTGEERASFFGWELKYAQAPTPSGATVFHSTDATSPGDRPALFLVYTQPEIPSCIDAEPETGRNAPSEEQTVTAYVTAGARVVNAIGDDGCTGGALGGVMVAWSISDDDPDVYISRSGDSATAKTGGGEGDAGPDTTTTRTSSDGFTVIAMKLDEPNRSGRNAGETRVVAAVGEAGSGALSDEVATLWLGSTPAICPTPSPATTPTSTPSPTQSPSPSTTSSPSATPPVCPSPTPTPTGSPTATLAPGAVDDLIAKPRNGTTIVLRFSATGLTGDNPPPARRYIIKRSKEPISDEASFDAAGALCGGVCSFDPEAVGDELRKTVRGLRSTTRYFFAVAARNETGQRAEMSNVADARTETDNVRPGKVRNLAAKPLSRTSIKLRWFAPGGDNMYPPPARRYIVKQASKKILSQKSFRRALTHCGGICRFEVERVADRILLTVTDLSPNTRYCYALKAKDEAGNTGPRSNVACARTR